MRKFERFNKQTEVKETYIACEGVLDSITANAIPNKGTNGKAYHKFAATVDTPSGKKHVGGQLYENLIPHLGGIPEVGDKLQFVSKLEDLQAKHNSRWGIGGVSYDEVTDDFLDAIMDL